MQREYETSEIFPRPFASVMLTTQRHPSLAVIFTFLKFSFLLTIGKHFALELFVTTAPLEQSKEKSQVILSLPDFRVARKGHFAFLALKIYVTQIKINARKVDK